MVFESVVVDLLNKFLGEYVENLDRSQLKLGIWGGDVVLKDLVLKESALDEFDLPVKTVAGHLGKLVLKIPWKNLYTAPVIATIEGLALLAVPNSSIKYNAEKEEKSKQEKKQKELQRIEEAKQKEAEKGEAKKDNDTFVEKLATQVIKNVQVTIKDIHIRYEDQYTYPKHPFALGVTLHSLAVQTTDENWKPCIIQEAVRMIHKLMSLDSLVVYWNSRTEMYSHMDAEIRREKFKQGITSQECKPDDISYILGPINSTAQLQLNPKPEQDGSNYSIPKALANIVMQELAVGLSKFQYQDLLELLQSFERMSIGVTYRKYKPEMLPYRGHAKEWWHFAFSCVLEEDIRRRHRNWSWEHIRQHRIICTKYHEAYKSKLSSKKISADTTAALKQCEESLDVFNITLIRKQAEVEVERIHKVEKEEKSGWFSGWWGGKKSEQEKTEGAATEIAKKFEEAMTPDEKKKLYAAIDYQENSAPAFYPTTFVENKVIFLLKNLSITIRDEEKEDQVVLRMDLSDVWMIFEQRPSAEAMQVKTTIGSLVIKGSKLEEKIPDIVISQMISKEIPLLDVLFETNPIDGYCDQRIHVSSRPLEVCYDALTINQLVDVFKPHEDVSLSQLQATAVSKLEEFKEMSATGLQYAIEHHKILDVNIDLSASYIIIPENGTFASDATKIVVDLGSIKMSSVPRDAAVPNVAKLARAGSSEAEILEEMITYSYDRFKILIQNIQVIVVVPGEDWKTVTELENSPLHLIPPMSFNVDFQKCLILDDPRLPKLKLGVCLSVLNINISDFRLLKMVKVLMSIPFPEDDSKNTKTPKLQELDPKVQTNTSETTALHMIEKTELKTVEAQDTGPMVQLTDLLFRFEIQEMSLNLLQHQPDKDAHLVKFSILSFETDVCLRTFDMSVDMLLGGISLQQPEFSMPSGEQVHLIGTTVEKGEDMYLLTLKYTNVQPKSPEFHTKHKSIMQKIKIDFSSVDVILHQEAILSVMKFSNDLVAEVLELQKKKDDSRKGVDDGIERKVEDEKKIEVTQPTSKKMKEEKKEDIDLSFEAHLEAVTLRITTSVSAMASVSIRGLDTGIVVQKSKTTVTAGLKDIVVRDPAEDTQHQQILSIVGSDAFDAKIIIFKDATENENYVDMQAVDTSVSLSLGQMKVVFLNKFVTCLLGFIDQFQTAKDAVMEASAAAAEAARQNMEEAYAKAARAALSIVIKAPVIIIPQHSKSSSALVADLGFLTLKNKFELGTVRNELGLPAIFDKICLELKNLKFSRALLDLETGGITAECLLLEPLSFNLDITRNLTINWYKEVAEVDVSGKLAAIKVSFGKEDYGMMMQTLKENLEEAQTEVTSTKKEVKDSVSKEEKKEIGNSVSSKTEVEPDDIVQQSIYKRVKLSFTLESVHLELYSGSSNLTKDLAVRDPAKSLAKFGLNVIAMKGEILSDNSMWTTIMLVNCLLDDSRCGRENGIFRLLKRKENICSKGMVDITYRQEVTQDRFVEIKVFSFDLILCVDYLMKLADFFTVESSQTHHNTAVSSKEEPKAVQKEPETSTMAKMTLHFRVEQPNIMLVENMEDINTNAIILNNEIQLKLWMTPEQKSIMGCISNLQIFSCCYNPVRRPETMAEILAPCCISVTAVAQQSGAMRADVNSSEIVLSVSPGTIEMLTKLSSSLSASADSSAEAVGSEKDWSDIWKTKTISQFDFWFLKTETAEEAAADLVIPPVPAIPVTQGEQFLMTVNSIILTLEAGIGKSTIPMLMLQSSCNVEVRDWSSQLQVDCGVSLEMAYFNSKLALWEPLIEPIEAIQEGQVIHRPWELRAQLQKNDDIPAMSPDEESDIKTIVIVPPVMTINVDSQDTLEVTVTKTSLDVLTSLGDAFSAAVHQTIQEKDLPSAPFIVKNETGVAVTLLLTESLFQVYGHDSSEIKEVVLEMGTEIQLMMQKKENGMKFGRRTHTLREQDEEEEIILTIKVNQMNYIRQIPVAKADKRYFPLPQRTEKGDQWGLVTDVQVHHGCKIVTLRTPLKVFNHFDNAVDVYYMTKRGNEVACVGTVEAGNVFNLPMHAVYTMTNELFFSVKGYTVSVVPFVWKDLQKNFTLKMLLQCNSRNQENGEPFFLNAFGELEHVYFEDTRKKTMASTCFNIHLHPTVILKNMLPIKVSYSLQGMTEEQDIKEGGKMQLVTSELGKSSIVLKISNYLEKEWVCKKELEASPAELSVWTFESFDGSVKMTLDLGMHSVIIRGTQIMTLYCPFWMINKTGLMLTYKGDEPGNILYHPENVEGPILFSFKPKSFFSKKKAVIKVEDSDWSDKFSLDAVGSSGTVTCKSAQVTYQVGIHIKLSNSSLTKHVIFTPYYMLINHGSYDMQCREVQENAEWITVPTGDCVPFWLKSNAKELIARVSGTTEETAVFPINTVHTTLLKLENKYGGINIDCQISESEVLITVDEYHDGFATVQMVNHTTDITLDFWEKGINDKRKLGPQEVLLYTWEKPTGQRKLGWNCGKSEHFDSLQKDDIGDFAPNSDEKKVLWVSFLDGMQRVLLITEDLNLAYTLAQGTGELERIQQDITISLHGVGLSLVNNLTKMELLYLGITSSGIIWEGKKSGGKRYKSLSVKECRIIEDAYQKYQSQLKIGEQPSPQQTLEGKIEVDFGLYTMIKPNKRKLKRSFQTGLWFQYRTSVHQKQIHAKVNRLQIDSQLADCVFPTVLAPVPPPKSVVAESIPKPFTELSIMQHVGEHSPVQQFKYFKILIQEFHIQVDQGFINALIDLFTADESKEEDDSKLFEKDLMLVKQELKMHATLQSSQEQKNFYDHLHFSPLKIHVSFSMTGTSGSGNQQPAQFHSSVINLLLQSVGVTLTEIQDVVFKLAYFERQHKFLNQQQITHEMQVHYVSQAIKQLYVLILGLDVIGNPFGLVVGLSKGVEDLFYEPFQGAIQGPGEFAEGLALGVRSLFGHALGGAAGAVSRITGTLGKGIAALSLDEDFQKKRREAMSRRPADLREGLAQSGKGLVMGVVDGVSGVIMKPIEGAKEQGVEGFFKGMGKGVVGLVTRPTVGVIDFASGTFDSVKRITDVSDDVSHLRPPRYFHTDGVVRPYVRQEAEGNRLFKGLEKGKFANTDIYVAHLVVTADGKVVLLVTDKRLIYISRNDITGQWQVEWQCTWNDITNIQITKKGLHIILKETKKKVFGLFSSGDSGRLVAVTNPERCSWIMLKIEEAKKQ